MKVDHHTLLTLTTYIIDRDIVWGTPRHAYQMTTGGKFIACRRRDELPLLRHLRRFQASLMQEVPASIEQAFRGGGGKQAGTSVAGPRQQRSRNMFFPDPLPKMTSPGSLHLEWKRCGRRNCRCCRGFLHGPYAYLRWRERGRQRKSYVVMAALTKTLEAIEGQRAQTPKTAEILRLLREPSYG